jgi:hypothetical protein
MTKVEIIEKLTSLNIPFNEDALKTELEALLPSNASVDCSVVGANEFLIFRNPANDGVESGTEFESCKCLELPKKQIQRYKNPETGAQLVSWVGLFAIEINGKTKKMPVICNGKMIALNASYGVVKTVGKSGFQAYNVM